jgi:hypothetical protein
MTDVGLGVTRRDLSERRRVDEVRKAEMRQDQPGLDERREDDKRRIREMTRRDQQGLDEQQWTCQSDKK